MSDNPYIQIILCTISIALLFIISVYLKSVQYLVNFILYNSLSITFLFGGLYFIFNIFYFYNHEIETQPLSLEEMVKNFFVKCIGEPITLSIGFYTTLIIIKLNVIDYSYISEKYNIYDRAFMIGVMILLLIYIIGKVAYIIKNQLNFWLLHISNYKKEINAKSS